MFSRKAIEQLVKDNQIEQIQKDTENLESSNRLQTMLQNGLYKIRKAKSPKNIVSGFEKICTVALLGKAYSESAYTAMQFLDVPEAHLRLIFNYYFMLHNPKKACLIHTILGLCYEKGIGTEKDLETAKQFYTLAAIQGYAPAQYHLGIHAVTVSEAVDYHRLAADQGYAPAQSNLGVYYAGIKENPETVIRLFQLAAEQENKDAQTNLYRYQQFLESQCPDKIDEMSLKSQPYILPYYDFMEKKKEKTLVTKYAASLKKKKETLKNCSIM